MRRWLLVLVVVLCVGIGAVALAVANLDAYVNANREAVAARVEGVLGRKVSFGEVGLSFAGGIGVRVSDLRVGDDPDFSQEDFVGAEAVDVLVRIVPALFGRIEVARVVLRSPRITVIRTSKGLSTDSLGGAGEQREPTPGGTRVPLLVSLLDVRDGTLRFVDRAAKPPVELEVAQLDVRASDISPTQPVEFEVEAAVLGATSRNLSASGVVGPLDAGAPRADLELRLDPLRLEQALRVGAVRAALPAELSASGPLRLTAHAEGTLDQLSFRLDGDAKGAALGFGTGFTKPAGAPLSLALRGTRKGDEVVIESADLELLDTGLQATARIANLADPKIDFTARSAAVAPASFGAGEPGDLLRDLDAKGSLGFPTAGPRGQATLRSPSGQLSGAAYQNLVVEVRMANQRLVIEKLSAAAFDGTLAATGSYETPRGVAPRFALDTKLQGMRLEKLLEAQSSAAARLISGTLDADLDLNGSGSGWEQIKRALSGDGSVRVANGVLRDFNPAGEAFRALAALPSFGGGGGLGAFIHNHPKVFGVEDTPFEALDGRFQIRDGWVNLREFALDATEYLIGGQGRYSLDGELDFKTLLTFSQALSDELLAADPRLRYLRGAAGRVELPVALRGTPPKLAVLPDVSHLAGSAAREVLVDALTKGLGGRSPSAGPAAGEGTSTSGDASAPAGEATAPRAPEAEPRAPTTPEEAGRELLRQGLEGLLGAPRKQP